MNYKYINNFKLWESLSSLPPEISPEEYCRQLGLFATEVYLRRGEINVTTDDAEAWINWWEKNNEGIKIYYFDFKCIQPIAGGVIDKDKIAINKNTHLPKHMKLFLPIHESAHLLQEREGRFSPYFDTVASGDKSGFLKAYSELETEANDIALSAFQEMNVLTRQFRREEPMIRGNQRAGEMIYPMMMHDIEKYKATDMFDLIRKQIL